MLKALGARVKALVVDGKDNVDLTKSVRNLASVEVPRRPRG